KLLLALGHHETLLLPGGGAGDAFGADWDLPQLVVWLIEVFGCVEVTLLRKLQRGVAALAFRAHIDKRRPLLKHKCRHDLVDRPLRSTRHGVPEICRRRIAVGVFLQVKVYSLPEGFRTQV